MIGEIVLAVLKFIESLLRKDTSGEDAKTNPGLRQRLRDRIRHHEQRLRDKGDPSAQR